MTLSSALVAVRGVECDDDVVRLACELLSAQKGNLYILHVIEVERGLPVEAVEKAVDSIVLGLPYRERYGSFSMGETIPYVLKNAPCRVILWRDPMWEASSNGQLSR